MKSLQHFLNEQEQINENKLTDFLKGTWKTIKGGAKAFVGDLKGVKWELVDIVDKKGKDIPDGMWQVQLRHPITKKGYKAHIIKDSDGLKGKKSRHRGTASLYRSFPKDFEPDREKGYKEGEVGFKHGTYKGDTIKLPDNVEILPLEDSDKVDTYGNSRKGHYKKMGIR